MKSIYDTKGDQIFDILTAGMNSVYSEEMDSPDADQLLFELKNEFVTKLYDFENLLEEFKNDLLECERTREAINDVLSPHDFDRIKF